MKTLYIENYLPYRIGVYLILSGRYIFLKCFKGSALIRHKDIFFKDFINLYKKKNTPKRYYFLVFDTTLASGNPSRFRKNL